MPASTPPPHKTASGGSAGTSSTAQPPPPRRWDPTKWHFDIDKYVNRVVPAPRWRLVPYPVSYFLGHRKREHVNRIGNIAMTFWAFVGIFLAIMFIELAVRSLPVVEGTGMLIVASFGAAAVLEFYTIESPLAQPRNAVLGQIISVTIGVCVCKLFALSPHFDSIRWVGGALACATATAAMALTKCVHPPAGATALLAVADRTAASLGWSLIYIVCLGCAIMLLTALLVNNIQSRFPSYWWTPEDLRRKAKPELVREKEGQEQPAGGADADAERQSSRTLTDDGARTESGEEVAVEVAPADRPEIEIRPGRVYIRGDVTLDPEEIVFLETIANRL